MPKMELPKSFRHHVIEQEAKRIQDDMPTTARLELRALLQTKKITFADYSLGCAILDGNRELIDLLKER